MLQKVQPPRWNPMRLAGKVLIFFGILSVPIIILPSFSGHRLSWLVFLFLIAALSVLLAIPFSWLEKRAEATATTLIGNQALRASLGLIVCCFVAMVLFHLIALHNDIIFIFAVIPTLLAVWFALRYWRILFKLTADKWHWNTFTCGVIGFCILAVGLTLQHFMTRDHGFFTTFVCSLAALGCFQSDKCRLPTKVFSSPNADKPQA